MKPTTLLATTLLAVAAAAGDVASAATFRSVAADRSSITFSYRQMGVAMDGRFRKFSARVDLDTARPERAKGQVDIDLASIDTGSSEADQEVAGKSWFHVAAHPRASFALRNLKPAAPGQYEATGLLSLKGQTRELRVPLKLSPKGSLTGSFVLRRADYGIGDGIWAKFDVVANEITVNLRLDLE